VSFGEQVAFINERQGRTCTPEEIVKMRKVCKVCVASSVVARSEPSTDVPVSPAQLGREVLDIAASHIRPGITTLELDRIVHEECVKRDAYPSPLGYHKFPRSVCTSINEVICHGEWSKEKGGRAPKPARSDRAFWQAFRTRDRSRMATSLISMFRSSTMAIIQI
jgi:hypothetical protein